MADEQPKRDEDVRAVADAHRAARRQVIKSAVAAFPVVLTVTAGTARAQSSGGSATASFALQGGSLEGGSEEFDVQQYLDEVTNLEGGDPFILDSGGIDSSKAERMPDDPSAPQQGLGDKAIDPYGL